MARKPETRLQRKIKEALKEKYGGFWVKIHGGPFQARGLPDLLGIVNGKIFWLEVKRPGKHGTSLQLKTILQLRENGVVADLVETVEEAINLVGRHAPHTPVQFSEKSAFLRPDKEILRALHGATIRESSRVRKKDRRSVRFR